ncbi:MAG: tetratricopeptide repeat protein [Clostridia bacterium]|nr:tetratricopeptide repeat protein [Deltaproteobacteria bacterium]
MRWTPLLLLILAACAGSRNQTRSATSEPPLSSKDQLAMGRAYAQQQKFPQSIAAYEEARRRGSVGRTESAELASIYDVTNDYPNAERIYREWLVKTPDDAEFAQQLGLTLLLENKNDEGLVELTRAQKLAPDDLRIQQDYAYGLIQTGDIKSAISVLDTIVLKDQSRAEAWLLLADAHARNGAYEAAIEDCTSALKADGTLGDALKLRARLRMQIDDYEHAFADYELLARGRSQDAGAYLGSAGALIALNRVDDAKVRVERAEKLAGPDHPWVKLRNAQLAWRRGDRAGYESLQKMTLEHPDSLELWRDVKDAARKFNDKATAKDAAAQLARLQRPVQKVVE